MSFLRKSVFFSAGQFVGIVLTFLMGILYARVIGTEGIGQLRLFDMVKVIGGGLAAVGVGPASIYFINNLKHSKTRIATVNLYFAMVSGMVTFGAILGLVLLAPGYFGRISLGVAIPFAFGVSLAPTFSVLSQIMFAEMATVRLVVSQLVGTLVSIVAGSILAIMHYLTVPNAILIGAAASIASTVVVIAYQRRYIDWSIRFDWQLFRQIWIYGLKLASSGVLLLVSMELSVILLGYLIPGQFTEVGLYSRAATICGLAIMLPRLIAPLLYSKWSSVSGEARSRQIEMALRVTVAYSVVTMVILILGAKYVIWLMYGKAFIAAAPALQILAPAALFFSIYMVSCSAIVGDGRGGLMNWILVGTVLVMGFLIWLLVPRIGIIGAAIGTACGNVFLGVTTLTACQRLFGVRPLRCILATNDDLRHFLLSLRGPNAQPVTEQVADNEERTSTITGARA